MPDQSTSAGAVAPDHRDLLAVDPERTGVSLDPNRPSAVDRVELKEVGAGRGVAGDLVDVDELQVVAIPAGTQREPPHPPEAVDRDPRHAPAPSSSPHQGRDATRYLVPATHVPPRSTCPRGPAGPSPRSACRECRGIRRRSPSSRRRRPTRPSRGSGAAGDGRRGRSRSRPSPRPRRGGGARPAGSRLPRLRDDRRRRVRRVRGSSASGPRCEDRRRGRWTSACPHRLGGRSEPSTSEPERDVDEADQDRDLDQRPDDSRQRLAGGGAEDADRHRDRQLEVCSRRRSTQASRCAGSRSRMPGPRGTRW